MTGTAAQAKALLEVKPQMDEAGVNLIALSVGETLFLTLLWQPPAFPCLLLSEPCWPCGVHLQISYWPSTHVIAAIRCAGEGAPVLREGAIPRGQPLPGP